MSLTLGSGRYSSGTRCGDMAPPTGQDFVRLHHEQAALFSTTHSRCSHIHHSPLNGGRGLQAVSPAQTSLQKGIFRPYTHTFLVLHVKNRAHWCIQVMNCTHHRTHAGCTHWHGTAGRAHHTEEKPARKLYPFATQKC
ncbi:hypothetical protein ABW21_db0208497 [Orbilia brochopaga]|nr:hypothetical protein ABW21_db0208497 [Drechslerella brochopaga]